MSKAQIADQLHIRRPTIIDWLKRDTYADNRGWKAHTGRRYSVDDEQRVKSIKEAMMKRGDYFLGAPHVQMHYSKQYPYLSLPSEWYINEVARKHSLQTHEPQKKQKGKGVVERQLFPVKSIVNLGRIHQSADFIGKKFIAGRKEPVSVFSTSYYQWLKMYHIYRVFSETALSAIECLNRLWTTCPVPDVMRIDNGMTFRGTGRTDGRIGTFVKFLLNIGITPLFSAAYRSYTNPHIEGHNRTFTQKLWSQHHFTSVDEIDTECDRFNTESRTFYEWKFKERLSQKSLRYLSLERVVPTDTLRSTKGKKVCFIRFVECWSEEQWKYGIVVLNRFIHIAPEYHNQYVFVELDMETAMLHVYSEQDGIKTEIDCQMFPFTL